MRKLLAFAIVILLLGPCVTRAEEYYENQLNQGIRDSDTYAYLLIKESRENRAEAVKLLKKALLHSPGLPAVYFELARANFSFSSEGVLDSVDYLVQGIAAYSKDFWWSFKLTGSLFFAFLLSFVIAFAVIVIIRFFADMKMISHDLTEANLSPMILILPLSLSLISPLLFIASALMLFGIYMKKMDRALVYLFLIFVAFTPLLFMEASLFVNSFSSGNLKAVVQVNASKDNGYALSVLQNGNTEDEMFSYALALKRTGRYEEAISIYKKILGKRPDPKTYVNLGNCYVGLYNFAEDRKYYLQDAINNYEEAIKLRPLASAYYNLSQVSREMIDFSKGNEYFTSALSLNRVAVGEYSTINARHPNRFVVDETLTRFDLSDYAQERSKQVFSFGLLSMPLFLMTPIALALMLAFYLMSTKLKQKSYRCRKCSAVLCAKCEKRLTWGQLCPQCYGSLVKLDELDTKERVSRLLSIYEKQRRHRRLLKVFAFFLPGSPQIFAGRILYGFFFLWPFLFFILLPLADYVFVTETTLFSHYFLKSVSFFAAAFIYLVSNLITRERLSKGWL